jgi:hypothetical protein
MSVGDGLRERLTSACTRRVASRPAGDTARYPPMRWSWPGLSAGRASRIAGTSGRRCTIRLDGARTSRMPTDTVARFCWNSMPRSIVTSASYSVPIRRRSSPFVMPIQPRRTTVSTLWPRSAAARSTGSCSSRRTRTSQQRSAGEVERGDRLVAFHGWELAKKLVQGLAAFEVIEQRLDRNACADEHRRPAEDVRVAEHDVAYPGHAGSSVYTRSNRAYNSGIQPMAFSRG